MKKKGLVYRMTMIVGLSAVFMQCGGELFYSRFIRDFRNKQLAKEKEVSDKMNNYNELSEEEKEMELDAQQKRKGVLSGWMDERQRRLDKIKNAKERP